MLLTKDWDLEEFDVDGGDDDGGVGIEFAGCNGGSGGGDMGEDTGTIKVEVFNCAIGGGGRVVLEPEPTVTYRL